MPRRWASGEGSCWDMAVLVGGHHLTDHVDLGSRQLMGRQSWAGSGVRQAALTFALPGVVPRLRQADHAEGDAERKDRPSAFNRPDEEFLAVFGDSRTGESEGGCLPDVSRVG